MSTVIHLDYETHSAVNIAKTGPTRYAKDPSTGIVCLAYAIDDGPVQAWWPGLPPPTELIEMAHQGHPIYAHNSAFEACIWKWVMPYYFPAGRSTPNWRCTQAIAQYHALPGGLDAVASFLGLDAQKDKEAAKIMRRCAKAKKFSAISWDDLMATVEYCKQDVRVEREIHQRLGDLPGNELEIWKLDQAMNARGVNVDTALAETIMAEVAEAQSAFPPRLIELSDGAIDKPTQRERILKWVQERMNIADLTADTIRRTLAKPNLDPEVREMLEIRQLGSKTSTAKYQVFLDRYVDGRLCDNLRYHGATTGRWSGQGVQLQNLPRPLFDETDEVAERVLAGEDYGHNPFDMAKSLIRSTVISDPGHHLIVADYSAIEPRVLAWLAGEDWKLDAFREYDAGEGPDLYKLSFSRSFGVPVESVDYDQRQIGKCQELALGYGGAVGAYVTMSKTYGIDVGDYYHVVHEADPSLVDWCSTRYYGEKRDMDHATWVTAEAIKTAWRRANKNIVDLWYSTFDDALLTIRSGESHGSFSLVDGVLRFYLPSGRWMSYWKPRIVEGRYGHEITYYRPSNGRMVSARTYGGKLIENLTQGVARDVMASAMLRLDILGVDLRLTVHDEIVGTAKIEDSHFQFDLMRRVMQDPKDWMAGLPLVAEGYVSSRYRK